MLAPSALQADPLVASCLFGSPTKMLWRATVYITDSVPFRSVGHHLDRRRNMIEEEMR